MTEKKVEQSNFSKVSAINCNQHTEKKNGLTYLSWAWAWQIFCDFYPDATYKILKDENMNAMFGSEATGYMVYTEVTADNKTHEMWLPVMDFKNKSILNPTTFDVNKAIMRCLTKNLAMFGLGLYIYAGEDLPEDVDNKEVKEVAARQITELKAKLLNDKIVATATDYNKFIGYFKIESIDKMTESQYVEAIEMLKKKEVKHE